MCYGLAMAKKNDYRAVINIKSLVYMIIIDYVLSIWPSVMQLANQMLIVE